MSNSKVSIIIPHWNGIEILSDCLESLAQTEYTNLEIIVVDNASTDGSPDWVNINYPSVKLVEYDQNYGYAGGCNRGAGLATGVNLDTWNSLTNTQREIFKNVFSHENTYTLAEFNHHNSIALNTLINKHGVQMRSFSKEIMNELKLKSNEVLEDVATKDTISNEIYLSFMDNLKRLRNWSKHSELAYMASRED